MQVQPSARAPGVSSPLAFGCLILIGLLVALAGGRFLWQGVRPSVTKPEILPTIVFGAILTAAGLFIIVGAWYTAAAEARQEMLKAQNPGMPWMWRDDWARGYVKDKTRGTVIGIWIVAILWNAISFPLAWFLVWPEFAKGNRQVLLALLFPFVGIIILLWALQETLRRLRFGTSICSLDEVPIVLGRVFRGQVELHTNALPATGYRLHITSVFRVSDRSSTTETVLWDEEIVVDAAAAIQSPSGTRIPFELATPPDAHPTNESNPSVRYSWRLDVSADLPGVAYAAQFDLPVFQTSVFQTSNRVDGDDFASHEEHHRAEAAHRALAPVSGVMITLLPDGSTEYRIDTYKTFGMVLKWVLFLAIWNAVIVAMIGFEIPWGISVFFIAFDLLFIASTIDYFLGRSIITVDTKSVRVRREWLRMSSTTSYDAAAMESIDGVSKGQASFGITLKFRDGRTRALVGGLPDRERADSVAAKMMVNLGRLGP